MPVHQPTPRRSAAKQAALGRRLNATRTMAASLVAATVEMEGETREFIRRDCPHGVLFFVQSTADTSRYYPITWHEGVFETTVECERTSKRLIARLQAWLKSQAEIEAVQAEYLNEQRMNQFRAGNFYEVEGPCKKTTDRRSGEAA